MLGSAMQRAGATARDQVSGFSAADAVAQTTVPRVDLFAQPRALCLDGGVNFRQLARGGCNVCFVHVAFLRRLDAVASIIPPRGLKGDFFVVGTDSEAACGPQVSVHNTGWL